MTDPAAIAAFQQAEARATAALNITRALARGFGESTTAAYDHFTRYQAEVARSGPVHDAAASGLVAASEQFGAVRDVVEGSEVLGASAHARTATRQASQLAALGRPAGTRLDQWLATTGGELAQLATAAGREPPTALLDGLRAGALEMNEIAIRALGLEDVVMRAAEAAALGGSLHGAVVPPPPASPFTSFVPTASAAGHSRGGGGGGGGGGGWGTAYITDDPMDGALVVAREARRLPPEVAQPLPGLGMGLLTTVIPMVGGIVLSHARDAGDLAHNGHIPHQEYGVDGVVRHLAGMGRMNPDLPNESEINMPVFRERVREEVQRQLYERLEAGRAPDRVVMSYEGGRLHPERYELQSLAPYVPGFEVTWVRDPATGQWRPLPGDIPPEIGSVPDLDLLLDPRVSHQRVLDGYFGDPDERGLPGRVDVQRGETPVEEAAVDRPAMNQPVVNHGDAGVVAGLDPTHASPAPSPEKDATRQDGKRDAWPANESLDRLADQTATAAGWARLGSGEGVIGLTPTSNPVREEGDRAATDDDGHGDRNDDDHGDERPADHDSTGQRASSVTEEPVCRSVEPSSPAPAPPVSHQPITPPQPSTNVCLQPEDHTREAPSQSFTPASLSPAHPPSVHSDGDSDAGQSTQPHLESPSLSPHAPAVCGDAHDERASGHGHDGQSCGPAGSDHSHGSPSLSPYASVDRGDGSGAEDKHTKHDHHEEHAEHHHHAPVDHAPPIRWQQ